MDKAEQILAALQYRWAALFTGNSITTSSSPTSRNSDAPAVRDNVLAGKVVKYVTEHPDRSFTAITLAREMNEDTLKVSRVLFRQTAKGRLVKRGHGVYGAKLPLVSEAA